MAKPQRPSETISIPLWRLPLIIAGGLLALFVLLQLIPVERDNPPLHTPADGAVVRASLAALAALGRPLELGAKAGCTEAGVYAATGIPSVVFGPGRAAGNVHAPNEHVAVAELREAVEFYTRIIGEHCR